MGSVRGVLGGVHAHTDSELLRVRVCGPNASIQAECD